MARIALRPHRAAGCAELVKTGLPSSTRAPASTRADAAPHTQVPSAGPSAPDGVPGGRPRRGRRTAAGRREAPEHVAHPVCPAEHVQRVHAQLGRPAHVRVDPVADHDDALGRLVGRLPVHDRLGLADRCRDGAGHGGDHIDERAVRRNQPPVGGHGDVEVRGDQPRRAGRRCTPPRGRATPPEDRSRSAPGADRRCRGGDRRRPDLAEAASAPSPPTASPVQPGNSSATNRAAATAEVTTSPAVAATPNPRRWSTTAAGVRDALLVMKVMRTPSRRTASMALRHRAHRTTAVDHAVQVEEHVPVAGDQKRRNRADPTRPATPGPDLVGSLMSPRRHGTRPPGPKRTGCRSGRRHEEHPQGRRERERAGNAARLEPGPAEGRRHDLEVADVGQHRAPHHRLHVVDAAGRRPSGWRYRSPRR